MKHILTATGICDALATPLGAHAEEIYAGFAKDGNEGVDFSGIINHLRALSRSA